MASGLKTREFGFLAGTDEVVFFNVVGDFVVVTGRVGFFVGICVGRVGVVRLVVFGRLVVVVRLVVGLVVGLVVVRLVVVDIVGGCVGNSFSCTILVHSSSVIFSSFS